MSPAETLARGYAIVHGPDGRALHDPAEVAPGDRLDIRLHRGRLSATANGQDPDHD